jgi:hypothetical protein
LTIHLVVTGSAKCVLSALTPRARGVKERNDTPTRKNGDEGAFLAGKVIIHVGRDTRKERRNLEGCSKTHEETAETDVALGNKAQGTESANPDGCM